VEKVKKGDGVACDAMTRSSKMSARAIFSDNYRVTLYDSCLFNHEKGFIMQVADKMAVSIHYTLTNDDGEVIDSSIGHEPLDYLHGQGSIISGLEKALQGKAVGDTFTIRIEAEDAYGEFHEERVQVISRSLFEGIDNIETGMQFQADVSSGPGVVTVVNIEGDDITIDGNHPLAGLALTFAVEVVDVKPATQDELTHGHVHGAGCHH
jgi:FKBP-type peptidyl-prolyl cis-trans isomerase SlyD